MNVQISQGYNDFGTLALAYNQEWYHNSFLINLYTDCHSGRTSFLTTYSGYEALFSYILNTYCCMLL